jgi:hypothetical protein
MTKTISRTMFVILAALSLVSTSLMGQSKSTAMVNIPFTFVAGEKQYPAGEYSVQTSAMPNAVWLRSGDTGSNQVLLSHPAAARQDQGESWLRFHKYGDRYFLSQIVIAGAATGQELPASRAEREHLASSGVTREVVTLVATR